MFLISNSEVMGEMVFFCNVSLGFQIPLLIKYVHNLVLAISKDKHDGLNFNQHIQFALEREIYNSVPLLYTLLIRVYCWNA